MADLFERVMSFYSLVDKTMDPSQRDTPLVVWHKKNVFFSKTFIFLCSQRVITCGTLIRSIPTDYSYF